MKKIELNLKYYGKAVNEVAYTSGTKHSLSYIKEEIEKLQYFAKKNKQEVQFEVALKYGYGWRSGQLFGVNDDISHFDPDNITLASGRVSGS